MKNIKMRFLILVFVPMLLFSACGDGRTEIPDVSQYTSVYLLDAVTQTCKKDLSLSSQNYEVKIYAAYGGSRYDYGDINITLKVDLSLVDIYNTTYGGDFRQFPLENVQFDENMLHIENGSCYSTGASLKLSIKGLNAFQEYMLPITISEISGQLAANEQLRTIYYVFNVGVTEFDRETWEIVDFSSEETVGQPGAINQGCVVNVLDNDINSFWHTAFDNGSGWNPIAPPHWLVVDMKEAKTISGFVIAPRAGSIDGCPESGYYQVSNDNITWETVGTFDNLPDSSDKKYLSLPDEIEARYFKFVVTRAHGYQGGTVWCVVGELGVY